MKILAHSLQQHLSLISAAVSLYIPQALLDYAKQAEGYVPGNLGWYVFMIKFDLDFLLIGKLLADSFYTGNKPKALQRRGV